MTHKDLMLLVDDYASAYKNNLVLHPSVEQARATLSAALLKVVQDAERLDYLQNTQQTAYTCTHQHKMVGTTIDRLVTTTLVFDGWAVGQEAEPVPTIREAIDAAMQEQL
jgi:hypothetical protein